MIDFRYHLVSLVSVFVALAVGIVLGAGPLQKPLEEGVSRTLQQQVDALREDRQQLRDQLDSSQAGVEHRDDVIDQVTPTLVRDRLAGRSVALVVLPDVDTGRVDELRNQLEEAGADLTGRVDVQSGWTDPASADERADLAAELVAGLPGGAAPADDTGTPALLAGLLARAVVAPTASGAGTPDPAARAILDGLLDADLVSVDGFEDGRASMALVLAPAVESATVTGTASPSPPAVQSGEPPDDGEPWRPLLVALDTGSEGTVVLGPGSAATEGGLLAEVRNDADLRAEVTTVDTGGTAMGDLTAVFALAEQAAGSAGAYGFGAGAAAALPDLVRAGAASTPAPTEPTPTEPTPTRKGAP